MAFDKTQPASPQPKANKPKNTQSPCNNKIRLSVAQMKAQKARRAYRQSILMKITRRKAAMITHIINQVTHLSTYLNKMHRQTSILDNDRSTANKPLDQDTNNNTASLQESSKEIDKPDVTDTQSNDQTYSTNTNPISNTCTSQIIIITNDGALTMDVTSETSILEIKNTFKN